MSTLAKDITHEEGYSASRWATAHVAAIARQTLPEAPVITAADVVCILPGHDLWDVWPLQRPDGSVAEIAGGQLWMILSAPHMADPGLRHDAHPSAAPA
jgi:levansucrase